MFRSLILLLVPLFGCTAAKGTYHLVEAEQTFALAREADAAERAIYAWTLAESYMLKAREEYENADYEAAERMAAEGARWADVARQIAQDMEKNLIFDGSPIDVQDAPSQGGQE